MAFAIKAPISDLSSASFEASTSLSVTPLFASENDGGSGLVTRGIVTSVESVASYQEKRAKLRA